MSRFNRRGSPPHLDVRSRHLVDSKLINVKKFHSYFKVYLMDVPLIGGKELKNRLSNRFGWVNLNKSNFKINSIFRSNSLRPLRHGMALAT